ncbi:MAG: phosphonate metabolism transcriptional regulator PhnF [Leptolyngbyaceae bacterium]|nr:phosphonate metabolism transcriptional regulator PhnF [Leptolyngbyaceae bacterium]
MSIYADIADKLRQDIRQGVYKEGDKLPTEQRLAELFGVNRHTLRQAIALLRSDGLVRVEQGRGTFVASTPIRYAIGRRVRYNETLTSHGLVAESQFLRAVEVPATDAVAISLEIQPGDPVAMVERLALANGAPISISSGYFPLVRFPDFLSDVHQSRLQRLGSISKFLQQSFNCDHIRRQTKVSARTVQPQDARLLALPLNQPILLAESINVDQTNTVIEYGVTRFRGDCMELVFENDVLDAAL